MGRIEAPTEVMGQLMILGMVTGWIVPTYLRKIGSVWFWVSHELYKEREFDETSSGADLMPASNTLLARESSRSTSQVEPMVIYRWVTPPFGNQELIFCDLVWSFKGELSIALFLIGTTDGYWTCIERHNGIPPARSPCLSFHWDWTMRQSVSICTWTLKLACITARHKAQYQRISDVAVIHACSSNPRDSPSTKPAPAMPLPVNCLKASTLFTLVCRVLYHGYLTTRTGKK